MSKHCSGERSNRLGDLRTHVVEKFGKYREAADNDTDGQLGESPKAHDRYVVGDVGRSANLPGIVCTQNRRHTRAGFLC